MTEQWSVETSDANNLTLFVVLHLLMWFYSDALFALWGPLNQIIYFVNHYRSPQSPLQTVVLLFTSLGFEDNSRCKKL